MTYKSIGLLIYKNEQACLVLQIIRLNLFVHKGFNSI